MGVVCNNKTNLLFWNARGISNRKTEYFNSLEANNMAVAFLNETHIQSSSKFRCTGLIEQEDQVMHNFSYKKRSTRKYFFLKLQDMEATAIHLHINYALITVISVCNPLGKIAERQLDLLLQTDNKGFLAGEFFCRTGDSVTVLDKLCFTD
jgi:hypothetical protein